MNTKEYFQILDIYGYKNQTLKMVEEMSELTQAIMKLHFEERSLPDKVSDNYVEELADVYLLLEQLRYGLTMKDQRRFLEIVQYKIDRTLNRRMK